MGRKSDIEHALLIGLDMAQRVENVHYNTRGGLSDDTMRHVGAAKYKISEALKLLHSMSFDAPSVLPDRIPEETSCTCAILGPMAPCSWCTDSDRLTKSED